MAHLNYTPPKPTDPPYATTDIEKLAVAADDTMAEVLETLQDVTAKANSLVGRYNSIESRISRKE